MIEVAISHYSDNTDSFAARIKQATYKICAVRRKKQLTFRWKPIGE